MPQRLQISGSRAIILIRLMVGIVFLSEGIQKFLYPAEMGPGRFAKIGIPSPELMGPFSLPKLPRYGVWSSLHEARVDLCMWLGSLFLILVSAKMSAGGKQDDGRG